MAFGFAGAGKSVFVNIGAKVGDFKRGMNDARGHLGTFTKDVNKGLGAAGVSFGRFGQVAKAGLAGAAVGLAALAGAGIASAITSFSAFDAKMTESVAIMGNVSETLRGDMSDAAREVGRTTTFTAGQAAESFFFLASAGLDAAESIDALPKVAAFAQAGMFDMATATDLLTDAQSALGLAVDDTGENLENMTRVSDVLVKANVLANASVRQFSEALTNKAAASLRLLNKDVEEGVAVLAAYADQGTKGATAGEQLSIVLRDLQTAALNNKAAFDAYDVSVFDSSGSVRNMADIIADLEGALGGLSDEQVRTTLTTMGFQDRSISALTALVGTSDAIRGYEADLRNAGGTTDEIANNQLESLSAQFDLLKSRVSDAAIGVGEDLAPQLEEIIPSLLHFVDTMAAVITSLGPTFSAALGAAMTAVEAFSWTMLRVTGLWDDSARQGAELLEVMAAIRRENVAGSTAFEQLGHALMDLQSTGSLTKDAFEAVSAALGVTLDDQIDVLRVMKESGHGSRELSHWLAELEGQMSDQTLAAEDARLANRVLGQSMRDSAGDAAEHGDQVSLASEKVLTLAERYDIATEAHSNWAAELKTSSDPVFKAIDQLGRLEDAQEKVTELQEAGKTDTDEYRRAQLDLAEAFLETQSALDEVDANSINDTIFVLAEALEISKSEARELLQQLGLLDGKRVNTVIDLSVQGPRQMIAAGGKMQAQAAGGINLARPGGLVTLTAEAGSNEAVVPLNNRGAVFMAETMAHAMRRFQTPATPAAASGGGRSVVYAPQFHNPVAADWSAESRKAELVFANIVRHVEGGW